MLDQSRIKDLRTGIERSDTQKVLDGDLDEFVEASLKSGLEAGSKRIDALIAQRRSREAAIQRLAPQARDPGSAGMTDLSDPDRHDRPDAARSRRREPA